MIVKKLVKRTKVFFYDVQGNLIDAIEYVGKPNISAEKKRLSARYVVPSYEYGVYEMSEIDFMKYAKLVEEKDDKELID